MSDPSSLLSTRPLADVIAVYRSREISLATLLATAQALAKDLPEGAEVINLCSNRFHFLVYFCATLLCRGKSILPPNRQPGTIAALLDNAPSGRLVVCDGDVDLAEPLLVSSRVFTQVEVVEASFPVVVPHIALDAPIVEVYTSGSTGSPKKLVKTWRILAGTAEKLCARLDAQPEVHWDLMATVPCQHMYGLEASVMMPLRGKFVCHEHTPFFPEDVVSQLADKCRKVRLVTTPVHLRAVVQSHQNLPESLAQIISATAPLADAVAALAEQNSRAEVYEIFGFSEAGSVATRRTLSGPQWELLEGFYFNHQPAILLCSDHLPAPETFPDSLDVVDDTHFRFLARAGDHINIGGKRMSLSDLLIKLQSLPAVTDAHLYLARDGDGRPTGFVVSESPVKDVLQALSQVVDPVFLPRPLRKVSAIKRNATGKVTHAELLAMLDDND